MWSLGNKLGFKSDDVCMNMHKLGSQLGNKREKGSKKKHDNYLQQIAKGKYNQDQIKQLLEGIRL